MNLQAAFLAVKLKVLDQWNQKRNEMASIYLSKIKNSLIKLPLVLDNVQAAWYLFVIEVSNRDQFKEYLIQNGIESLIHYPIPPAQQKAYENIPFVQTEIYHADKLISIPIGPHLTSEDVLHVVDVVNRYK